MLNYKRQLSEKEEKAVPAEFWGLGKTLKRKFILKKSSITIQNDFGMGYIYFFFWQGDFLNSVSLDNCFE